MPRRLVALAVLLAAIAVLGGSLGAPRAWAPPNVCAPGGGGDGSAASPFLIGDTAQLSALAAVPMCSTGAWHFRQTADIDLSGVWTTGVWAPIGPQGSPFNGTYDGGGHTITGLLVDQTAVSTWKGLFGMLDGATVRNLAIARGVIIGRSSYYGVLAGEASNGSLIENVSIADSSVSSQGTGSEYMGIVVGGLENSTIRNARVTGGSIAIAVTNDYIGGITGRVLGGSAVERSSADVSISGAGSYVGGLVGIVDNAGTITDSYARGTVQGTFAVGGLLGAFYGGGGPITRSYATVHVASTREIGGLVGSVMETPSAADAVASFWDTQTSGMATSANGAVGKTTAELKAHSTYADAGWPIAAGFDAARTWGLCPGVNDGYPFLTWQYASAPVGCTAPAAAPAAPAPATLSVRNARVVGNTIRTLVSVSGPGTVLQTGGVQAAPRGIPDPAHEPEERNLSHGTRATLLVSCSTRRTAKAAGTLSLSCPLNARTLRIVRRRAVVILVRTTFRPATGTAASASTAVALPKRPARPAGTGTAAVTG